MCQFQQLYSSATGYVIRCNACSCFQILFDGTMLSISGEEFEKFLGQIAHHSQDHLPEDPHVKGVILSTPRHGVHLVLSTYEFHQLRKMMESADAEVKALELIELFDE